MKFSSLSFCYFCLCLSFFFLVFGCLCVEKFPFISFMFTPFDLYRIVSHFLHVCSTLFRYFRSLLAHIFRFVCSFGPSLPPMNNDCAWFRVLVVFYRHSNATISTAWASLSIHGRHSFGVENHWMRENVTQKVRTNTNSSEMATSIRPTNKNNINNGRRRHSLAPPILFNCDKVID